MSDVDNNATDDLRADIEAAMSGGTQEVTHEEAQPVVERTERARDEAGRFAKKAEPVETEGVPAAETAVPEQPANPAPVTRKAPQSWKQELKDQFNTLPEAFQEEILRRESDYSKGIQRYAESHKFAEQFKPHLDRWAPYFNQLQVTPDQAFNTLIQAEYNLRHGSPAQKQAAFMKLAQDYGITLGQPQTEQQQTNPDLQQAFQRVQQLEEIIRNQQYNRQQEAQRKQQAEQAELQKQIEEFSSSPNRPHFEAVREDMSRLLQAGYAESLEDAYEKAVWARPDIRSTLLKEQEAKRIEEMAKVAEQAKAKAVSLKGSPPGAAVRVAGASIRDDILAAMQGGRL